MPPAAERERPKVPHHELVRVIGRGAYGEIWMARSLTGALRAIKVVDRRSFESDKAFQREFEGMARFEPISRSDSGFVDILHVGQDDAGHFFYYVMELADDVTGTHVEPEAYVARTLRSELSRRSRLLVEECLSIGISLTRALASLHQHGLVHRDIKPANVIFVGGVPKIADIGLVAAHGNDSFVGTEGYVPPEGPGSVQADLFSLGKVLYEMAMGKDRLDFPALHTDLSNMAPQERQRLMLLNDVLLRACSADCAVRYASAEELLIDLERIQEGRPAVRKSRLSAPLLGGGVLAALAAVWYLSQQRSLPGSAVIATDPPDAMIVLDEKMKRSPARFENLRPGEHTGRIMLAGFDPAPLHVQVGPKQEVHPAPIHLTRSHGGLAISSQPAHAAFTLWRDGQQVETGQTPATLPSLMTGEYEVVVSLDNRERREKLEVRRGETTSCEVEFASGALQISSDPEGATITVDGKPAGAAPIELKLPEGAHVISARYPHWPAQEQKVEIQGAQSAQAAFTFAKGSIKITSAPGGAVVEAKGKELGKTPLLLEDLQPGAVQYELHLHGFRTQRVTGEIKPGEQAFLGARFVQRSGPERGAPWDNSLGMKFVPLGEVLFCVWPTRVRDYDVFCEATGRAHPSPDFSQDPTHPVVLVNWDDATAFCAWLTQKEQTAGTLEASQKYRLPTDLEWSQAAGLPPESGATPEERDGKSREFPWGKQWPPPAGVGNYADATSKRGKPSIPGYHDGFLQTSPVGSFRANALGLYDMGGNVWQWVQDAYKGGTRAKDWGVLRGGSWATAAQAELRTSYRDVIDRGERDVIFGFRVVLEPGS